MKKAIGMFAVALIAVVYLTGCTSAQKKTEKEPDVISFTMETNQVLILQFVEKNTNKTAVVNQKTKPAKVAEPLKTKPAIKK